MSSGQYWIDRAERIVLEAEKQGAELTRSLIGFYSKTGKQLQKEIDAFYGRYAAENQITIQDAQKRLTATELKSFREELSIYLLEAQRLGLGNHHQAYLRTLSGRAYISRQQELLAQVKHQVEVLFGLQEDAMTKTLEGVYTDSYYRSLFDIHQGLGFGVDFARLNTGQVEALMKKPWLGANYSDRVWENKSRLLQQLEQVIPQAFALGENSRQLGSQVTKRLGVSESAAQRLVRTEVNHAANESAKKAYQEHGVEEYEFLATLDNRTSESCAALDGKVFRVTDAQAGVNYPPMHPNCRSTTVPYFPPDEFDSGSMRAARDLGGAYYTVPASMTYKEWQTIHLGKKLTRTEETAILSYIGAPSYALNAKLRDGEPLSAEDKRMVLALDSAIEKLPKYQGTVQRSIFFDTDAAANQYALSLLNDGLQPAYTSASTGVYDESDSVRLIIQSKSAADLRGFNRREQEVLFPRGTSFQVVDMRLVDGKRTIWLEEV